MKPLRAAAALAAVLLMGCPALVLEKKGNVRLSVEAEGSTDAGARTILPILDVRSFRVYFSGPSTAGPFAVPAGQASFELDPGRWTARAEGLNAAGQVVAAGESGPFEVPLGASVPVAIRASRVATGIGRIDLQLSWPSDLDPPVSNVAVEYAPASDMDARIGAAPGSFAATLAGTPARLSWRQELPAGSYAVWIEFDRGSGLVKAYSESVQIGGNAASAHAEDLRREFFTEIPEAPAALSATKAANGVQLRWTDASKTENGFRVHRRPTPSGNWTQVGPVLGQNAESCLDSPLPPAGRYEYRVEAFNAFGSSFSEAASATISAAPFRYVADHEVATLEILRSIPAAFAENARDSLRVAYFHTSHGTHVSYGVFGLPDFSGYPEFKTRFAVSTTKKAGALYFQDYAFDSSGPMRPYQDLSRADSNWPDWTEKMRSFLETNTDINVVMWSWCDIVGHDVDAYLASMETLIGEYGQGGAKIGTGSGKTRPDPVDFVFMTGHARLSSQPSNTGDGMPYPQAKKIVDHCREKGRYCIDYYAIDTHDMAGAYWDDTTDECASAKYNAATPGTSSNFYRDYQNSTAEGISWYQNRSSPGGAFALGQHTNQHITSNRKAFAFWWVLARLKGWDGAAAAP